MGPTYTPDEVSLCLTSELTAANKHFNLRKYPNEVKKAGKSVLTPDSQVPDWLHQMKIILEELNEGVVVADSNTRVVFVNEALLRLTGYQRAELQGRTPATIFPPEDVPFVMQQHAMTERFGRYRQEFSIPHHNGKKIPVIYSGGGGPRSRWTGVPAHHSH